MENGISARYGLYFHVDIYFKIQRSKYFWHHEVSFYTFNRFLINHLFKTIVLFTKCCTNWNWILLESCGYGENEFAWEFKYIYLIKYVVCTVSYDEWIQIILETIYVQWKLMYHFWIQSVLTINAKQGWKPICPHYDPFLPFFWHCIFSDEEFSKSIAKNLWYTLPICISLWNNYLIVFR